MADFTIKDDGSVIVAKSLNAKCRTVAFAIVCLAEYRGHDELAYIKENNPLAQRAYAVVAANLLAEKIADQRVRDLIDEYVKAGVMKFV